MKITTNILSPLTTKEINLLTKEVNETIAAVAETRTKVFSSADLWDIQRRRRTPSIRRYTI